MTDLQRGRVVGLESVFRDLEPTLMLALPRCGSRDQACPCAPCRVNGAYSLFLGRLSKITSEERPT